MAALVATNADAKRARTEPPAEPAATSVLVQFRSTDAVELGARLDVPSTATRAQLEALVNELLGQAGAPRPYA